MKKALNNPFLTVLLFFAVEYVVLAYIYYVSLVYWIRDEYLFCIFFAVPGLCVLMCFLPEKHILYRKQFRYFTIGLFILTVLLFIAYSYLLALGRAFQH